VQERPRLDELPAGRDPGRVEHQRLEPLLLGHGLGIPDPGLEGRVRGGGAKLVAHRGQDLGVHRGEHLGECAGELRAGRGAEQDGARDDRLAGLVAL
jgi:hypothetical protein